MNQKNYKMKKKKSKVKYTYWRWPVLYSRLLPFSKYNPTAKTIRIPIARCFSDSATEEERCYKIAIDVLAKMRTDIVETGFFNIKKKVNPKFWRLVLNYIRFRLSHSKSAHTAKNVMRKALKKFGGLIAENISTGEAQDWLEGFIEQGYEINSVDVFRAFLSAIFNTWNKTHTDERFFIKNPITKIKKFGSGNVRGYYLDPDKFCRYLKVAYEIDPYFADFWQGGWQTGGRRPMEVAKYDWEHVDLDAGEISVSGKITKTEEPDIVCISPWLRHYLESTPLEKRHGPVFKTASGDRWMPHRWNPKIILVREKTGDPKVWVRDVRRGFITTRLREGTPVKEVMQATGQKDVKTVLRYFQPRDDAKQRMTEAASSDLKAMDSTRQVPPPPSPSPDSSPADGKNKDGGDDEGGNDDGNGTVFLPAA